MFDSVLNTPLLEFLYLSTWLIVLIFWVFSLGMTADVMCNFSAEAHIKAAWPKFWVENQMHKSGNFTNMLLKMFKHVKHIINTM